MRVLVASLDEHRVGERVLRARLHSPGAALAEDRDGVDVRVDRLAHATDAPEKDAARAEHLGVEPGRDVAPDRRIERRERSVARRERALDVAELAQELADEGLRLDLERGDLRRVRDLGGLSGHDGAAREVSLVEIVARAPQEAETDRTRRGQPAREPAKRLEVQEALAPPSERPVRAFERLVPVDAPPVVGAQKRESALVVADRERRLVAAARRVGGLEIEVGGAPVVLAAREVARDDGGREAARERRPAEVLAELAVHADALLRIERDVRDVARERMTEVDELPLAIAEPARAEPDDGLVVVAGRELHDVIDRQRTAGDREPVDDGVLRGGQLADAIAEELLERRGQRAEAGVAPIRSREHRAAVAPLALAVSDLERPALEQRVDHLEQEERIAAHRGRSSAHTCRAPSRTPSRASTSRTCSSGVKPRSSMRMTPSRTLSTRSSGRVTSSTRIGRGSTPCAISPMTSRLALSAHCSPSTTSTSGWARAIDASRLRSPATMCFLRADASSSPPLI